MNKLLNVSSSPHVRSSVTTQNLMLDVVIAMIPAAAFGVFHFGLHALLVMMSRLRPVWPANMYMRSYEQAHHHRT